MTEAIKITGLREVQKKLYQLSQQLGDRVVIAALRAGANLMKRAVVAGVPVKTGKLKKGFKVARSKIHRGRMSTDMIGVYLALRKGKDAPFYGRFINDGWNTHGSRTGNRSAIRAAFGSRTGRKTLPGKTNVPGKHFIQAAFNSTKENSARLIVETATAGAEVLARKVGLK